MALSRLKTDPPPPPNPTVRSIPANRHLIFSFFGILPSAGVWKGIDLGLISLSQVIRTSDCPDSAVQASGVARPIWHVCEFMFPIYRLLRMNTRKTRCSRTSAAMQSCKLSIHQLECLSIYSHSSDVKQQSMCSPGQLLVGGPPNVSSIAGILVKPSRRYCQLAILI